MTTVPVSYLLAFPAVLFAIGFFGVIARRDLIYMLIGVEIMLNAAGLAFVIAGAAWSQPDGQVMFLFILAMAAVELSIGLALIIQIHRRLKTLNGDDLRSMRG
jgi:NADH-quinone oxidoreductase subunit K